MEVRPDERSPALEVDRAQRHQSALALEDAAEDLRAVGGAERVLAGQLESQSDRVDGLRQLLPGRGVIRGDVVGDRRRGPRQVLLFERLERAAIPADEDRFRHDEGHQGSQDQRTGQEDEEANPTSTGTPAHDSVIIAAASSHSAAPTASSIEARPIASSRTPASPGRRGLLVEREKRRQPHGIADGLRERPEPRKRRAHRSPRPPRRGRRGGARSRARRRCPRRPPRRA